MTDQQIEGTTWTERDVDALLALFDEGCYPSEADCREARIVLSALRFDVVAKTARARRSGPEAFARLASRHHELRRKAERLADVLRVAGALAQIGGAS